MIVLERKASSKLLVLEALMRRLPESDTDYEYYFDLYMRTKKGYEGELYVDREWNEITIPTRYYLFHNYETINEIGNSHQIDTIFLCSNFILLLEIKTITGRVDIDNSKHQLIRTRIDGTIESFTNPIDQIERHGLFLKRTLSKLNSSVPIEHAIIIARDSGIIGTVPGHIPIFHTSGLQSKVRYFFEKNSRRQIPNEQIEKIKRKLIKMYLPKVWKPNINPTKLMNGVLCEKCQYKFRMKFDYGTFTCPACRNKDKQAFIQALVDYRHLHSEWVSNKVLREYLLVESRYAVNRLIKDLNLEFDGTFRNRKYFIPENLINKVNRT